MSRSGIHYDDDGVRRALAAARAGLPRELGTLGRAVFTRIGARATSSYMRDAGKGAGPRSASDGGALRIVTGRLARSLTGARFSGAQESINEIEIRGSRVVLRKGSKVPYAAAHEFGFGGSVSVPAHQRTITQAFGRSIAPTVVDVTGHTRQASVPKRSYLQPALEAEATWAAQYLGTRVARYFSQTMGAR